MKLVFSLVAAVALATVANACDRVQTIVVPQHQVVTTHAVVVQPVVAVQQVVAVQHVQQFAVQHVAVQHVQQVAVRQRVQAVRGGGVVQRGLININRR